MTLNHKVFVAAWLTASIFVLAGCDMLDMYDQKRFKTYGRTEFFADKRQSRTLIEGTVARGELRENEHLFAGTVNGKLADTFPFNLKKEDLMRGKERFNIYCAPCHAETGQGNGMIVQRGYRKPPNFHSDVYREKPVGHFFQVISNGFGVMPSYAAQVDVKDRWLIAAYLKALQLSQNVPAKDLSETDRQKLDQPAAPNAAEESEGHK
jgi:mono/diheme cytochrome c family protein